MAVDTLFEHVVRFFYARRGARRIEWADLDRDMWTMMASMAPGERRRLAQLLRRLYGHAFNECYDPVRNGEYRLIQRLAPVLRCVFDVGANVGSWTIRLLAHTSAATVHAFEPVPDVFARLSDRLCGHAEVRLNGFGLLDRDATVILNVVPGDSHRSSIYALDLPTREVACRFVTGDGYVERAGIAAIDFLKIDCEGAEPQVLAGLARTLERGAVTVVQLEYGPLNIQSRWLLRDLYARFRDLGYRVGRLYPAYVDFKDYEADDETFFGGNFVACLGSRADLIGLISA